MRIREDLMLTFAASGKLNGGNVHHGRALIAAYQQAIETALDRRCQGPTRKAAVLHVRRCEDALRTFTAELSAREGRRVPTPYERLLAVSATGGRQ